MSDAELDRIFPDRRAEALETIRSITNNTAARLFIPRTMNTVAIPVQLRTIAGGRDQIKIDLSNHVAKPYKLRSLVNVLEVECPGLQSRILDQEQKLRRHVAIFVDQRDARVLQEERVKEFKRRYPELADEEGRAELNEDPLELQLYGFEEVTILPALG